MAPATGQYRQRGLIDAAPLCDHRVVTDDDGSTPGVYRRPQLDPAPLTAEQRTTARQIGSALLERANEVSRELVTWLIDVFPELEPQRRNPATLTASVADNMHTIFTMYQRGLRPDDVEPPPNALVWPREMARESVPLSVLVRVYYVGHAMIWHRWVAPSVTGQTVADAAAIGARLHADLFDYLDNAAQRVAEQYVTEREDMRASADRQKAETVRRILAGRTVPDAVLGRLPYPARGRHLGVIVAADDGEAVDAGGLEPIASALVAPLASRTLVVSQGPREVWAWCARDAPLSATEAATVRSELQASGRRIHMMVGDVDSGVSGIRHTHDSARRLWAAVAASGRPGPTLTTAADSGLAGVLLADREGAVAFMRQQLGPLAGPDFEVLRQTLKIYLDTGGSLSRAAVALDVHRNTVRYRVAQAERLLDAPVVAPAPELSAALLIAAWIPPSA